MSTIDTQAVAAECRRWLERQCDLEDALRRTQAALEESERQRELLVGIVNKYTPPPVSSEWWGHPAKSSEPTIEPAPPARSTAWDFPAKPLGDVLDGIGMVRNDGPMTPFNPTRKPRPLQELWDEIDGLCRRFDYPTPNDKK